MAEHEIFIALIAAVSALVGSLLGSFLTKSTEHQQWLRTRKQEVYFNFVDHHDRARRILQDCASRKEPPGASFAEEVDKIHLQRAAVFVEVLQVSRMLDTLEKLAEHAASVTGFSRGEVSDKELEKTADELSDAYSALKMEMQIDLGVPAVATWAKIAKSKTRAINERMFMRLFRSQVLASVRNSPK